MNRLRAAWKASPFGHRALPAVATFVLLILVTACLYLARSFLIPVALAILLTFVLSPLVTLLEHRGLGTRGLGRVPSVIITVVLAGLLLGGAGWLLTSQLTTLVHDLPSYRRNIHEKMADLRGASDSALFQKAQGFVRQVARELDKAEQPASEEQPQPVKIVKDERTTLLTRLGAVAAPLMEPLASAALIVVLLIYMLIRRENLRDRIIRLIGRGQMTVTTKALNDAGHRISRYLLAQLVINGTFGIAAGIALFAIGVPYAVLWGFIAFALRYVPYVGPWLAALFPIALSLLVFDGWTKPILVVSVYLVLETISNLVMEPLLYGKSVGVSDAPLLVAVAFWTWLWGPLGLVLATPLTVCLVVLGKYVPHLHFFDVMLGDEPVFGNDVAFYQRLLAKNPQAAKEIVQSEQKSRSLGQVYDEVVIPALTFVRRDLGRDNVEAGTANAMVKSASELVEELEPSAQEVPNATQGEDSLFSAGGIDREAVLGGEKVQIAGLPSRDGPDTVALKMFRQLLDREKFHMEIAPSTLLVSEMMQTIERQQPALILIAALPPGGLSHTRHLCLRLQRRFPQAKILVGCWGLKKNVEKHQEQLTAAGAHHFGATLRQTLNQVNALYPVLSGETNGHAAVSPAPRKPHAAARKPSRRNRIQR